MLKSSIEKWATSAQTRRRGTSTSDFSTAFLSQAFADLHKDRIRSSNPTRAFQVKTSFGRGSLDEPVSNYPAGNTPSTLVMPNPRVVLTAAAYFFVPSITALREVLTT